MSATWFETVQRWAPTGLAALFVGSGFLHLARPSVFLPAVPSTLPARQAIILASGIAELACAAGLISGQRWAGRASAALLVAIFPGNLAVALATSTDPGSSRLAVAAAWVRLPVQIPLVWAALQARPAGARRPIS